MKDHPCEGFVRWIYPRLRPCTHCRALSSSKRVSIKGRMAWCKCDACGKRFKVAPIAAEVDAGGNTPMIVPLTNIAPDARVIYRLTSQ